METRAWRAEDSVSNWPTLTGLLPIAIGAVRFR